MLKTEITPLKEAQLNEYQINKNGSFCKYSLMCSVFIVVAIIGYASYNHLSPATPPNHTFAEIEGSPIPIPQEGNDKELVTIEYNIMIYQLQF